MAKKSIVFMLLILISGLLVFFSFHRTTSRSPWSFDEIRELVADKSAEEVLHLLGEPDSRRVVLGSSERWIWWNFTHLAGKDYPPEVRGNVGHLMILFQNPSGLSGERAPYAEWKIDEVSGGIEFRFPSENTPYSLLD